MILVVRHGQTEWNAAGRFQGRLDSKLTGLGERQAEALGRALDQALSGYGRPLPAFVSPAGRARRTAELAGRSIGLDLVYEPRLAEVSLGAWEGLTIEDIEARFPGVLARTDRLNWYFCGPGGETYEDMIVRVSGWLDGLEPGLTLAFTHGVTSRVLRGLYLGLSRREMLALATPQDGFFVLDGGQERFVAADLATA